MTHQTPRAPRLERRHGWGVTATLLLAAFAACSTDGPSGDNGSGSGGSGGLGVLTGGTSAGGGTQAGGASSGGFTVNGGSTNGVGGQGGSSGALAGGASGDGGALPGGGTASGGAQPVACDAAMAPSIQRLGFETVVQSDSFGALVYAAQAPGSSEWYLVDVLGKIWVYAEGKVKSEPFLDVSQELVDLLPDYDERGLLSLAFPKDYAASGKAYVALVPTSGAAEDHDLVLEYTRRATDPWQLDPASRKAIVDLEPGGVDGAGYNPGASGFDLNTIHNASTVQFGPDGMLYVAMGDGGGQCNSARPGTPQDITSPLGKVLRLDPSAPSPYAAAGNPFAKDGDPRVLHLGIRNSFRFSFDSLSGDLYLGEVGQWDFEEVNFAPAGAQGLNFGWPAYEANQENPAQRCNSSVELRAGDTHTSPIHEIGHGPQGSSGANLVVAVVGGTVYRGSAIPELQGAYFFGEYYAGHHMGALYQCGDKTSPVLTIRKGCDANFPNDACLVPAQGSDELGDVGSIVAGNDGELYLTANRTSLVKVVPAP
jgi:glucose/arabinose dehydrogenase